MSIQIDGASKKEHVYTCLDVKYKDILSIARLVIPENKIVSIVGSSGSGKTTLLKLFNRMITPDTGNIFFRGNNMNELDPVQLRRTAVMLPQNPLVFSGNMRDNLLAGCKYANKREPSDDELYDLLAEFDITKELSDGAGRLSGGEKQRLSLARVILMNPDVFLLDEPSSSLDDDTEKLIIDYVTGYSRKSNKTVIMVTHSKTVAAKYSDLRVTIDEGRIMASK